MTLLLAAVAAAVVVFRVRDAGLVRAAATALGVSLAVITAAVAGGQVATVADQAWNPEIVAALAGLASGVSLVAGAVDGLRPGGWISGSDPTDRARAAVLDVTPPWAVAVGGLFLAGVLASLGGGRGPVPIVVAVGSLIGGATALVVVAPVLGLVDRHRWGSQTGTDPSTAGFSAAGSPVAGSSAAGPISGTNDFRSAVPPLVWSVVLPLGLVAGLVLALGVGVAASSADPGSGLAVSGQGWTVLAVLGAAAGVGTWLLTGSRALAAVAFGLRSLLLVVVAVSTGLIVDGPMAVAVIALSGLVGLTWDIRFVRTASRTVVDPSLISVSSSISVAGGSVVSVADGSVVSVADGSVVSVADGSVGGGVLDGRVGSVGSVDGVDRLLEAIDQQDRWCLLGPAGLATAGLALGVGARMGLGFEADSGLAVGFAIAVGAILELVVGGLILRPALLGQGPAYQTLVRPLRQALAGPSGPSGPSGSVGSSGPSGAAEALPGPSETLDPSPADAEARFDDPVWRRVVARLLDDEFALEADPASAESSQVFLADSPVHRQFERRRELLVEHNLRVGGAGPRLIRVEVVSSRLPVRLRITVDRSENRLVDGAGRVVGVRPAERRTGTIWLVSDRQGRHLIAESIDGPIPDIPAS